MLSCYGLSSLGAPLSGTKNENVLDDRHTVIAADFHFLEIVSQGLVLV